MTDLGHLIFSCSPLNKSTCNRRKLVTYLSFYQDPLASLWVVYPALSKVCWSLQHTAPADCSLALGITRCNFELLLQAGNCLWWTVNICICMEYSSSCKDNNDSASHEIPTFYGTWWFITVFTKSCHHTLPWTRWIHSIMPQLLLNSSLIQSSHETSLQPFYVLEFFLFLFLLSFDEKSFKQNTEICIKHTKHFLIQYYIRPAMVLDRVAWKCMRYNHWLFLISHPDNTKNSVNINVKINEETDLINYCLHN